MNITHETPEYIAKRDSLGGGKFNGAYYYSREITDTIIPLVDTDRPWVTVNVPGRCFDHAIVFIHNNLHPENYDWLSSYDDLILVCGIPATCDKVAHLGTPLYLPLSVDIEDIMRFDTDRKRYDHAFAGRKSKRFGFRFPPGTLMLSGMERESMLKVMATCRNVYAVGRCAIEAKVLGCNVLPYDKRYPDPRLWRVIDNKEAGYMLDSMIRRIDG